MPNFISEQQIERALVQKLQHLYGYDSLDCHTEDCEDLNDGSGRTNKRDVILADRVREAAVRLNPKIPAPAIESALEKLLDRRQAMSLVAANQKIYNLLRDGIPVEFDDAKSKPQKERVYLQSRSRVRSAVESVLDSQLPHSYDRAVFTEKCNNVFDLMLDYAAQGLKWAA
jgi:type I restriction enzyme, R subunit